MNRRCALGRKDRYQPRGNVVMTPKPGGQSFLQALWSLSSTAAQSFLHAHQSLLKRQRSNRGALEDSGI